MNEFLHYVLLILLGMAAIGSSYFTVMGFYNWLHSPEYGLGAWGTLEYTMWVVLLVIAVLSIAGFLVVI
jgi:hypothetical protein